MLVSLPQWTALFSSSVFVSSIYAYRNCFFGNVSGIYLKRNFNSLQKDIENVSFNNVAGVHLNEVQMHVLTSTGGVGNFLEIFRLLLVHRG